MIIMKISVIIPMYNEEDNVLRTLVDVNSIMKDYTDYEEVIENLITGKQFEKRVFLAKKGDVFIWHANLVHGGMPVANPGLTRKSMVIHYYAKDVIKYHEISERPSLLEEG